MEEDPLCHACDLKEPEDAEHVLFACPRFQRERDFVTKHIGRPIAVGHCIDSILQSESNWITEANAAAFIMKALSRQ